MKLLFLLFNLGVASAAFKPADRDALLAATNACIATDDTGAECYACLNGDIKTSAVACAAGDTAVFISDWDTSEVTSMNSLFRSKLKFNQDLSQWDTSKVTNMWGMFWDTEFNYDISGWDVSKVTDFQYMFFTVPEFNQDLSCWKVASGNVANMFAYIGYSHTLCGWTVAEGANMFAGAHTGGLDPTCTPTGCNTPCAENEHVSGGTCTACQTGDINEAGDKPDEGDTSCTTPPAVCDACPVPLDMKAVSVGTKVVCEDTSIHCSGEWVKYGGGCYHPTCTATQSCCAPPAPCLENQHVSSGICEACPVGRHKAAGDQPPKATECWADGTCGGDTCVDANTESCTNHACECKVKFGGLTCHRDVTAAGIQQMLRESRKKALPTREDIIERQNTIKTFARDTLKQKIKQGKSVKEAITETKVVIEPEDLSQKAQAIVQQLAKTPVIAVAPANKDEQDTCDQGVDTAGCSMVDLSIESGELVILATDPDPGSWSVLASGGTVTSKQTRVSEFVYEMQCWDNGWGAKETLDVTNGAELYECNGNVIMISSQAGICTSTTCNNGNCTVDGSSYVCSCEAGWSGTHCDEASALSQCYEFDCSNYGGHKSVDHCGGTCGASNCCNYATKTAFDAVCDALTTSAEYVSNKCCHRDICI